MALTPEERRERKRKRMERFRPKHLFAVKANADEEKNAQDTVQDIFEEKSSLVVDDRFKFEITNSGTFSFHGIQVKQSGLHVVTTGKADEVLKTPSSTKDPEFTPDRNYKMEDFKRVKKLGKGAQGYVYKVQNTSSKAFFAEKTLSLDNQNAQGRHLITELTSLYDCKCDNIIKLYHAFYKDNKLHMMIEYMNMGSLEDVNKICPTIPESILAKISVQILNGLLYLHEKKKIVHRDIKPGNVLINSDGHVKLADFGMAGQSHGEKDIFETFQGTAIYMSPERMRGAAHSFNSDIWSFGLTLVECAMGRIPPAISQQSVMFGQSLDFDFSFLKNFTPEFESFLKRCLCPADERASARELLSSSFIEKYHLNKPSFRSWLFTNYLTPKKEILRKRREQKKNAVDKI